MDQTTDDRAIVSFYLRLTRRQRDVARLAGLGLSNRQIAERLSIAPSVVAEHLTHVYAELEEMSPAGSDPGLHGKRYLLIRALSRLAARHPDLV